MGLRPSDELLQYYPQDHEKRLDAIPWQKSFHNQNMVFFFHPKFLKKNEISSVRNAMCPLSTGLICLSCLWATSRFFSARCICITPSVANFISPLYPFFSVSGGLGKFSIGILS